jgi:hypothetical protein
MLFGNVATGMFPTNAPLEKCNEKPLFDVLLYRDYPLKNIGLTIGKTYTVYSTRTVSKQVTQNLWVAIDIWTVKNDYDKMVDVSTLFFKQLNTD